MVTFKFNNLSGMLQDFNRVLQGNKGDLMGNGHNRTSLGPIECKGTIWRGPLTQVSFD